MGLTENLLLNLYSIALLMVVNLHTRRHHDIRQLQNVLFVGLPADHPAFGDGRAGSF